ISASGMCDAGRIRHHLKHTLWRPESTILFVGYQADGSLGRRILDGAQRVKLFGEEIAVRARIVRFHGLSSHADRDGLVRWISHYTPRPQQVFVVHGDERAADNYAQTLTELGFAAHAPNYEEVYDLLENRMISPGIVLEPKVTPVDPGSPAWRRLEDVGRKLLDGLPHNTGGAYKDLAKFENQILPLIEKWDR
ncbi:MAG: MBL fold metallo-hydrolase, partial [Oscillospiraceae bacterium]|nr:MBL fold metallo-hydrolase [Oscillospiraceae bacterium]